MSRIGKQIVKLDEGVQVSLEGRQILVKGKSKTLRVSLAANLELKQEKDHVFIERTAEDSKTKALHGLAKALLQNAVTGVSKGWSKSLELNGVGYKASLSGKKLNLNLGFSHPIVYNIPEGIEIKVEKQTRLSIHGADKELVGLAAHQIKSYRPVEPYLAKGIKYSDEIVRRKAGKSGGGGGDKK